MTYEIADRAGTDGASLLEKSLTNFPTVGTLLETNSPRFLLSTASPVTIKASTADKIHILGKQHNIKVKLYEFIVLLTTKSLSYRSIENLICLVIQRA